MISLVASAGDGTGRDQCDVLNCNDGGLTFIPNIYVVQRTKTANIDNVILVLQAERESPCEVRGLSTLSTVLSYLSLVCQVHTGNTMLGLGKKSIPLL